jgi:hypothetical protein
MNNDKPMTATEVKAAQEAFEAHIGEGFRAAHTKLRYNMLVDPGKPGADRSAVTPPIGEDLRPKDPIKLGVSPSTEVINMDCTQDKEYWEGDV